MIRTLVNLWLSRARIRGTTWCVVSAVGLLAELIMAAPVPAIPEAAIPELICDRQPRAIGRAIAKRELGLDASVVVLAVNDVRCEALEGRRGGADMVNVALEIDTGTSRLYGIYHVHLAESEGVVSATPIFAFQALTTGAWREIWCSVISGLYPDERAEQRCPER
jgi:hypothetical protein